MYELNGLCYAGEPKPVFRVTALKPLRDYVLLVKFSNGETRLFDMEKHLDKGCFVELKPLDVFRTVYIDYGCPVWKNGDIDVAPEFVYENSIPTEESF